MRGLRSARDLDEVEIVFLTAVGMVSDEVAEHPCFARLSGVG